MALFVIDLLLLKCVKVYELCDNDWFDRGTGFCYLDRYIGLYVLIVDSKDYLETRLIEIEILEEYGFMK